MNSERMQLLPGDILEEDVELTLAELCRACHLSAEQVLDLVEYGVIEPNGRALLGWRFSGVCVRKVHRVMRLKRDLGVNTAGAALALDLIKEIEQMQSRLRRFEEKE